MMVLRGHADRVRGLAYSPDGRALASCGNDRTVRLWDVAAGRPGAVLRGGRRIVFAVAFAPDGSCLAAGGGDRTIRIWSARDRAPIDRWGTVEGPGLMMDGFKGHTTSVVALAIAPDGRTVVSGSGNREGTWPEGEVLVWDRDARHARSRLRLGKNGAWSLALAPGRPLIAVGTGMRRVVLWDPTETPAEVGFGYGIYGHGFRAEWAPGQEHLRAPIALWKEGVRSLAFAPDGRMLAGAAGWSVDLWNLDDGQCRAVLKGHRELVWSVAFAPDGRTLASGAHDGTVRLWDVTSGAERACWDWGIGAVDSVAFAPDGMTMAAGGAADVAVWDVG